MYLHKALNNFNEYYIIIYVKELYFHYNRPIHSYNIDQLFEAI